MPDDLEREVRDLARRVAALERLLWGRLSICGRFSIGLPRAAQARPPAPLPATTTAPPRPGPRPARSRRRLPPPRPHRIRHLRAPGRRRHRPPLRPPLAGLGRAHARRAPHRNRAAQPDLRAGALASAVGGHPALSRHLHLDGRRHPAALHRLRPGGLLAQGPADRGHHHHPGGTRHRRRPAHGHPRRPALHLRVSWPPPPPSKPPPASTTG